MEIARQAGASGSYQASPAAAYAPDVATRIAAGRDLAAIVSDTSGKHSRKEQIAAFDTLFGKVVTGQLAGWSDEDRKTVEHALGSSDIAKRAQEIHNISYKLAVASTEASTNTGRVFVDFFDSLSDTDKEIFALNMNPTDMTGKKKYTSIDQWRTDALSEAELFAYRKKAETPGFIEAEGGKYTQILSFLEQRDNAHKVGWGSALLKLLQAPADRVDLSAEARSAVRPAAGSSETFAAPRTQGSLLDTSV